SADLELHLIVGVVDVAAPHARPPLSARAHPARHDVRALLAGEGRIPTLADRLGHPEEVEILCLVPVPPVRERAGRRDRLVELVEPEQIARESKRRIERLSLEQPPTTNARPRRRSRGSPSFPEARATAASPPRAEYPHD